MRRYRIHGRFENEENKPDFPKYIAEKPGSAACCGLPECFLGYWLAFVLRFDTFNFDYYQRETFNFWIPWLILIHLVCFFVARFYNTRWEYCSIDEIFQIFLGSTVAAAICFLLVHYGSAFFYVSKFWRGVYVIAYVLIFGFVCITRISVRFAYRLRRSHLAGRMSDEFKRVMIVGAGEMGSMLIKDMKNAPESKGVPVVAIDDDPKKRGTRINGVKIIGGRNQIPALRRAIILTKSYWLCRRFPCRTSKKLCISALPQAVN